jgi:hypothetical protein
MSDLTSFRDYCRKMAGPPVAPGCPAATERALWLQMADEIDAYLATPHEAVDLFGEVTTEPAQPTAEETPA